MVTFSTDWSFTTSYWDQMFDDYAWVGRPLLRFLEIGCFEGRTTLWLLENVLTDDTSSIVVVDTFEGSPEFDHMGINGDTRDRFLANTNKYAKKIHIVQGKSQDWIPELKGQFNFIYVDGSHKAEDVFWDAQLAWKKLKYGGLMCFDDYLWGAGTGSPFDEPKIGIDLFMLDKQGEMVLRHNDYQIVVEKKLAA